MKKKLWIMMGLVLSMALAMAACAPAAQAQATDNGESQPQATAEAMNADDKEAEGTSMVLYDFEGNVVDIFADGKPVYLKAWASWCPSCLGGLHELDDLFAEDTSYKLVTIVAPGEYGEQSEADFIDWFTGLKDEFPNVEVLFDKNAAVMDSLSIRAFPSSYFFNSDGSLGGMQIGHIANSQIDEAMAKLK